MDRDDRDLFVRTVRHATASHTGAALDAALDDLGWRDALAADPHTAVAVLFEEQGAANATSPALDHVVGAALGVDPATTGTVLPALGSGEPPGAVEGEALAVRGLGVAALGGREVTAVVVRDGDGGPGLATVATADLALRPLGGLDPSLGLVEVVGAGVRVLTPSGPLPAAWADALAAGRRALAHELVGASRAMLRLAREHALDRIQFGRPIGSFQAVRHRLADTLVAVEAADAALEAAWDDRTPLAAAVAKAIAGRSGRTAARHCQQVLAGIGFTAEHPLHRHVRRVLVLDHLLGDARSLTRQLGDELLRTRRLPAILPL